MSEETRILIGVVFLCANFWAYFSMDRLPINMFAAGWMAAWLVFA